MNILDLKKLMLVPLACCVSIQQTDAKVEHNTQIERELQEAKFKNIDKEIEWFEEKITKLRFSGKRHGSSQSTGVASSVIEKGEDYQMGGILAYMPIDKQNRAFLIGAKVAGGNLPNNDPDNGGDLYTINERSHTERQLISYLNKERRIDESQTIHIYTYQPPCATTLISPRNPTAVDQNHNFPCCKYYTRLARKLSQTNFHIYFETPRFSDLFTYVNFDTKDEIDCLKALVTEYTNTIKKTSAIETLLEQLKNVRADKWLASAHEPKYRNIADKIRILLMNTIYNNKNILHEEIPEACRQTLEKLYQEILKKYAGNGDYANTINRIHIHILSNKKW